MEEERQECRMVLICSAYVRMLLFFITICNKAVAEREAVLSVYTQHKHGDRTDCTVF